mmetsp:Transcript_36477/g.79747  ORF Transcript_36477/g.79747 Transcript_36477/m.79747 type:complete len:106 (-) Transcript_36477:156-473(-)
MNIVKRKDSPPNHSSGQLDLPPSACFQPIKRSRSSLFCQDSFPFVLGRPETAAKSGARTIAAAPKTITTRIDLSMRPSTKRTTNYNDIKADLFMIETRPRHLSDA